MQEAAITDGEALSSAKEQSVLHLYGLEITPFGRPSDNRDNYTISESITQRINRPLATECPNNPATSPRKEGSEISVILDMNNINKISFKSLNNYPKNIYPHLFLSYSVEQQA